jgi:hypothetical protein
MRMKKGDKVMMLAKVWTEYYLGDDADLAPYKAHAQEPKENHRVLYRVRLTEPIYGIFVGVTNLKIGSRRITTEQEGLRTYRRPYFSERGSIQVAKVEPFRIEGKRTGIVFFNLVSALPEDIMNVNWKF